MSKDTPRVAFNIIQKKSTISAKKQAFQAGEQRHAGRPENRLEGRRTQKKRAARGGDNSGKHKRSYVSTLFYARVAATGNRKRPRKRNRLVKKLNNRSPKSPVTKPPRQPAPIANMFPTPRISRSHSRRRVAAVAALVVILRPRT